MIFSLKPEQYPLRLAYHAFPPCDRHSRWVCVVAIVDLCDMLFPFFYCLYTWKWMMDVSGQYFRFCMDPLFLALRLSPSLIPGTVHKVPHTSASLSALIFPWDISDLVPFYVTIALPLIWRHVIFHLENEIRLVRCESCSLGLNLHFSSDFSSDECCQVPPQASIGSCTFNLMSAAASL